jgi:hypothetical protein
VSRQFHFIESVYILVLHKFVLGIEQLLTVRA